ncbi:MAG TPA: VWA domain-containing protein [Gemmatimonadaceae bacterium]|nr:VWA domain-containing protein [Gemmatimonadaceae bacterium]
MFRLHAARPSTFASFLIAVLTLAAGAPRAAAQVRTLPAHDCEQRVCLKAPCWPAPCANHDPVVRTDRDVTVTLDGRVLRYVVTEKWTNRGPAIGEADYILPLPRGAVFEDLALEIDGELVTGEALDARRARHVYEEIVRKRKDPALVEWMGLGLLRARIFPIAPGETRTVVVRFRAVAEREGDALRIDVPAPRGEGMPSPRGAMHERESAHGSDISLRWPADAAFGDAWSPTHDAKVSRDGARRIARVEDATGTVTMLVPVRNDKGAAISMLAHAPRDDEGYALITLTPPVVRRTAEARPRDVTFVLDISGSMSGEKIDQARAAGHQFLNSLSNVDRFRLIAFSNDVEDFADGWTPATAAARRRAAAWLDALSVGGGTNIGGALERALEAKSRDGRLSLVLFLTDGAPTVGERRPEILAARAAELRGERRVFTFGIGADVNAALLEQLALDGAGTAHFVRPEEDVERVVGVVAERLTQPVATNLRVRASGVTLHALQPAGRLDLFAGQELVILARYRGAAERGRVTITGQTPDGPVTWQATVHFPERRSSDAFVGRLWAAQRVGWLSAERRKNGPSKEVDAEIRGLGERWGIPTELTSYLVLEPGMVPPRGTGVPISNTRQDRDAAGTRALAPQAAFESAKAAAAMREARSVADLAPRAEEQGVTQTSTRRFVLRDSVWVDTRPASDGARTERIRAYSAAYFDVMERLPELREAFALGERVEVHGRAVTIVLDPAGVETMSAASLAALTRDW